MPMNFQQKSDTANHNPMNVNKNLQNVEITARAFGSKANELQKLFDGVVDTGLVLSKVSYKRGINKFQHKN